MSGAGLPGLVRRVLLPFAFAYVLSYLYRSVNAVIAPDLVAQFDLSPAQLGLLDAAAAHLLVMALATMAGFLAWGNLAARCAARGISGLTVLAAGMGGAVGVQALLTAGWTGAPVLLWIAFGVFGTGGSVAYAILSHGFPASQAGRVITALNALVFSRSFALQWGMGAIIARWPAPVGHYHPDGFRAAFGASLLLQVLGYAWMVRAWRRSGGSSDPARRVLP